MSKLKPEVDEGRRGFLKVAAAGAPLGVVLAATGAKADVAAEGADAGSGLRVTPHVSAYLKTARH